MEEKVFTHLRTHDPILHDVAVSIKFKQRPRRGNDYFRNIIRAIVGQQLSVKAATTIFGRFEVLVHKKIDPENVVKIPLEHMRNAGMSHAKTRYVHEFAQMVLDKKIDLLKLPQMNDEDAIQELLKIKGVGKWTAEMFLMFSLNRTDIFSHGDAGLQRAMKKIYNLEKYDFEEFETISKKWSPYRTFACDILWQSLDNSPMK